MHLWSDVSRAGGSAALGQAFSYVWALAGWLADDWPAWVYSHDRRKLLRKEEEAP